MNSATYQRSMRLAAATVFACGFLASCGGAREARQVKAEPMPQIYYPVMEEKTDAAPGSLWQGNGGIFHDNRARRINDLVTIRVVESVSGTKSATTDTERTSSDDRSISKFLGLPLDLGMKDLMGMGQAFSPGTAGETSNKMKGKGATQRAGTLTALITAKVLDVLPNGNLVLEARKETLVNNENQILVLRGIVRPSDIRSDNTVISTYVADAQISLTGDGVIDDRQSPGWMTRALDVVWPF